MAQVMKQTILIIFLAIMALGAAAQSPFSFQVKAGVGTSNFHGKNIESDTRIAYKAGLGINYELNRTWMLQSSLNFVSIGARYEIDYFGKADMNELYLQLPVLIAARLNLGRNYSASLSAGPYIAYGIGGKTSGETDRYDYDSSHHGGNNYHFRIDTFGSMLDDKMGNIRFDAGLMLGINIEYQRFIFGAELQWGMIKVNKQINSVLSYYEFDEISPKNLASFFTVGYRF